MKVSKIEITNFKRFSKLTIGDIPQSTKLVIIVGPNGCGKSSLFDAFNHYYRHNVGFGINNDQEYFKKLATETFDWARSVSIQFHDLIKDGLDKKSMYFRTAYRNDPDFNISNFTQVKKPYEELRINRFIDNDKAVSANYQRLVHDTMSGVYSEKNDEMYVKELREKLIGKVRQSMQNVFEDLTLNSIGSPLNDGSFYFKKGSVDSYHYKNLSSGEKAAFDLLLDLILKIEYYDNSLFFIDEPETHMHTSLQGKLIEELYRLVPENSQMWLTSHSLGVMRKAKEISSENTGTVIFIDFDEVDFDTEVNLSPAYIDDLIWQKFLSIALDGYETISNPEIIIMCEGDINGNGRKDFDASIYRTIFKSKYPNISFVSGGSCNDLKTQNHVGFNLLTQVLGNSKVVRLIDRDDHSDQEIKELEKENICVIGRRNIESYLLDDELIMKLAVQFEKTDLQDKAIEIKQEELKSSVNSGNPPDDLKKISGKIYVKLKKLFGLTRCGNNVNSFMKDTMTPLITSDTDIYKELEKDIILPILSNIDQSKV